MNPLPDINSAYPLLKQEKEQRNNLSLSMEEMSTALSAQNQNYIPPRPNQIIPTRERHTKETCYQMHSYLRKQLALTNGPQQPRKPFQK